MLDRAAAYKTSQILTASPLERVVLLYRGAIRFATAQVAATEAGQREQAHHASLRAQEIVSALRSTLDLSAGPIAAQLDGLYIFVNARLVAGNLGRDPRPVREAITVLAGLLEAWSELAARTGSGATQPASAPASAGAPFQGVPSASAGTGGGFPGVTSAPATAAAASLAPGLSATAPAQLPGRPAGASPTANGSALRGAAAYAAVR